MIEMVKTKLNVTDRPQKKDAVGIQAVAHSKGPAFRHAR